MTATINALSNTENSRFQARLAIAEEYFYTEDDIISALFHAKRALYAYIFDMLKPSQKDELRNLSLGLLLNVGIVKNQLLEKCGFPDFVIRQMVSICNIAVHEDSITFDKALEVFSLISQLK